MNKIRQKLDKIIGSAYLSSFTVAFVLTIIVVGLSLEFYINDFREMSLNVLAEAHGMIFDILIIGILLFWLRDRSEAKQRVRQYEDEIDDFRMWQSEEAAFRNVGNIKRLNRHGINNIDLVGSYLVKTNLSKAELAGSNLNTADMTNSMLIGTNFHSSRLNQTIFENSNLNHANLESTFASGANFKDAFLIKANFKNAFLIKTNFKNSYLMEADLSGCALAEANFEDANLYKADLRKAQGLTVEQLSKAKSLYLAEFDPEIREALQEEIPDLLG
jgi:uncharacterized protein YjbI with pentapeptide repeats